jgi:glyoxylate utilization-related uncharacterized protein
VAYIFHKDQLPRLEGASGGRVHLMEGEATITLNAKTHDVAKGNGIYLGPSESASIAHRGTAPHKLFQLVVPRQGA